MDPIRLFPTAPVLSPICLGGSTFGRENDESVAFTLMDYAVSRGITLIDTAATYSNGASEQIIGAWRASRRPVAGQLDHCHENLSALHPGRY